MSLVKFNVCISYSNDFMSLFSNVIKFNLFFSAGSLWQFEIEYDIEEYLGIVSFISHSLRWISNLESPWPLFMGFYFSFPFVAFAFRFFHVAEHWTD